MDVTVGGSYEHINLEPVENGYKVCYTEKVRNPMVAESTYDMDMYKYERKELVFQAAGKTKAAMKKALNEAITKFKALHEEMIGSDD